MEKYLVAKINMAEFREGQNCRMLFHFCNIYVNQEYRLDCSSQSLHPLCCYVTSWCLQVGCKFSHWFWAYLSDLLLLMECSPVSGLGSLHVGLSTMRRVRDMLLIFLEWWSSMVLIWTSVKVWTLAWQPQPAKTSPEQLNLWHVDCSRTLPQIQGASGKRIKQAKRKQTSKIHHCSFSLFLFSPQGGRQLLRLLVYLVGCSLARNLVCLTCLYETLYAHCCPDVFLSNTDGAPGEVIWVKCVSSGSYWNPACPHLSQGTHAKPWEPGGLYSLQDLIHFCGFDIGSRINTPLLCLTAFLIAVELLKHSRAWYLNLKR